jgi:hypothetical protein
MSSNFISYSLFEPKKVYEHRTYDDDKTKKDRYWYNLPSLAIINKALYPSYEMHLSVCPATVKHPLFKFYDRLCEVDSHYSYSIVEDSYSGHEPALWRMELLWRKGAQIVLSRDIDSIPNVDEYRCTKFFESSPYSVHTIRSHEHHCNFPCRMLIGLSGFKPPLIPPGLLTPTFKGFKKMHALPEKLLEDPTVKWNSDQLTVINAFTTNEFFTADHFLDSKINNQHRYAEFFCHEPTFDELEGVEVTPLAQRVFGMVSRFKVAEWAGQPCDTRGPFLNELLDIPQTLSVRNILNEDSRLQDFYLNVKSH